MPFAMFEHVINDHRIIITGNLLLHCNFRKCLPDGDFLQATNQCMKWTKIHSKKQLAFETWTKNLFGITWDRMPNLITITPPNKQSVGEQVSIHSHHTVNHVIETFCNAIFIKKINNYGIQLALLPLANRQRCKYCTTMTWTMNDSWSTNMYLRLDK